MTFAPLLIVAALGSIGILAAPSPALQEAALKIVVLEGEGAVNIIRQKTATTPVVEVRDRNDLPVAGASVTFSISGSGASFGGAQSLTVVTNAAGRAAATGLTPTGTGALQISATATLQGQTASATIAQTNVLTAAQAAGASAGSAGSAGAASGGGGISGTTLGIVGAAAGAGAVAAAKTLGGQEPATIPATVSGPFSGTLTVALSGPVAGLPSCAKDFALTGTLKLTLQQNEANVTGALDGTGRSELTDNVPIGGQSLMVLAFCVESLLIAGGQNGRYGPFAFSGSVAGTSSNLQYAQSTTLSAQFNGPDASGIATADRRYTFSGRVDAGTITGTLGISVRGQAGNVVTAGTTAIPITLR